MTGPSVVQSDGVILVLDGRRQGRPDDKRRGLASSDGSPSATPGRPIQRYSFSSSFLFDFLFLFLIPTLTYLSTSICLINQFCASVVDGRRRPSTPSKDETVSSFVVLTPSWTDGTTGISVHMRAGAPQESTDKEFIVRRVRRVKRTRGANGGCGATKFPAQYLKTAKAG